MEILQGVLDAAIEVGVAVAHSVRPRQPTRAEVARPAAWVRYLAKAGRQAVIDVVDDVRHGDLAALSRARLPLVVIDPLNLPRRQVTSVGATNFAGGVAATEHLLSLGHRRIAYMGADASFAFTQARMHGYRAALGGVGIEVPEGYVHGEEPRHHGGVAGGTVLLDHPRSVRWAGWPYGPRSRWPAARSLTLITLNSPLSSSFAARRRRRQGEATGSSVTV